jgi:hypothetical protein
MSDESIEFRRIEDRCQELKQWILHKAPQCVTEERHLVEGSEERGYWAHGYLSALLDVLRLFSRDVPGEQYGEGDASRSKYAA